MTATHHGRPKGYTRSADFLVAPIADVPIEDRMTIFEVAQAMGVTPDNLSQPAKFLRLAGLVPPMSRLRRGIFCFDARVVTPWIECHRAAIDATITEHKAVHARRWGRE